MHSSTSNSVTCRLLDSDYGIHLGYDVIEVELEVVDNCLLSVRMMDLASSRRKLCLCVFAVI